MAVANPPGSVLIVGAGIIGTSIAYHLAASGSPGVTVVDRAGVAEGSTARATGAIRAQFTSTPNVALAHRSVTLFGRLSEDTGEPFDFRQHGYLFLLTDPDRLDAFRRAVDLQNSQGVPSRMLSPDEVADLYPQARTDDLLGATYCATDGSGSPTDAATAYARAARRAGAQVRTQCRVTGFLRDTGGAVCGVATTDGPIGADTVIVAAGPQSRELCRTLDLDIPVAPHRRQVCAIGPLDWVHPALPFVVDMGTGAYLHPGSAGSVIGGTDRDVGEGEDTTVDWDLVPALLDALVARFPAMAQATVTRAWAGLREMTPDDHALIGPVPEVPNLWLATGFSGHGFMQAPAVGEAVGQLLLRGASDIDITALRPSRFADGRPILEDGVF